MEKSYYTEEVNICVNSTVRRKNYREDGRWIQVEEEQRNEA